MYLTDSLLTGLAASPTIVLPVRLAPMKASIPAAAAGTANAAQQRSSGFAQLASSSGRLRTSVACQASLSRADFGSSPQGDSRRLLKYVRDVSPNEVQVFIEQSPPAVVAAFKQTVANMVGTLPPQHFSVTIDTVADSLAQLMQTMLRTGYLLHNVKYQMELELALRGAAASMSAPEHTSNLQGAASSPSVLADSIDAADGPGLILPGTASTPIGSLSAASAIEPEIVSSTTDEDSASLMATSPATSSSSTSMMVGAWAHADDEYAPGVQCKVDGHVLRWHPTHGVERMAAQHYIKLLEDRVKALEQQLQQQQGARPASQPSLPLPQATAPPTYSLPVSTSFASEALSPHHSSPGMAAAAAASAAAAAAFGGYAAAGGAGPHAAGHTDLLSYLRTLDATALSSLADCGQDVADAMQAFVARLMGTHERDQLRAMTSEFTAVELSKLLLWLLVVGWSLRALEVRSSWFEEEPGGAAEPLGAALYGGTGAATRSGDGEGPAGTSPWSW